MKQDYKQVMIMSSIVFAWILILLFCIYAPYTRQVDGLKAQIDSNKVSIKAIETYKQKYQDLNAYEAKLQENEQLLSEKVPAYLQEDEVLANLNEFAKSANVQIISLEPATDKIKISIRGDYFAVLNFLRQLNISPRLIMIKSASVLLEENNLLICNITLQIYADNYN